MSIVSELLADNWQVETMVQKKPDLQMRALLLGEKRVLHLPSEIALKTGSKRNSSLSQKQA